MGRVLGKSQPYDWNTFSGGRVLRGSSRHADPEESSTKEGTPSRNSQRIAALLRRSANGGLGDVCLRERSQPSNYGGEGAGAPVQARIAKLKASPDADPKRIEWF